MNRIYQVVIVEFDRNGLPKLASDRPVFETSDRGDAMSFAEGYNAAPANSLLNRWAAVRLLGCGEPIDAAQHLRNKSM